ncbi:hypothetical protein AMELA_G00082300 [Ameiurus melas]|uniref:Uncharacterized protein n=1 Tax=Ameiurus melas TaxID=219545 RepID=A0A7J6AZW2_AMEME|nr:hypothetical protein AMELA_G00082300 [Ameiurus melas]
MMWDSSFFSPAGSFVQEEASFRVTGNLELIQGDIGHKAGYTLDRVPVHCRAQSYTHSHTHSYTTDTLDTPISLPCMSLVWGRKPEYPEETGRTCKLRTHMAPAGIEPRTLEV